MHVFAFHYYSIKNSTFIVTCITTVVVSGPLGCCKDHQEGLLNILVYYVTMLVSSGCCAVGASQMDTLDRFDLGSRRSSCHLERLLVLVITLDTIYL